MKDEQQMAGLEPVHYYTDHLGNDCVMRRDEVDAIERSGKWAHGATLDVPAARGGNVPYSVCSAPCLSFSGIRSVGEA